MGLVHQYPYYVKFDIVVCRDRTFEEVCVWLKENARFGYIMYGVYQVRFADEGDALAFKLRWL